MAAAQFSDGLKVLIWLSLFMFLSSTGMVTNKRTFVELPFPISVLFIQVLSTVAVCVVQGRVCGAENFSLLNREIAPTMMKVSAWWLVPIIVNMLALNFLPVETLSVFRAFSAVITAVGEYFKIGVTFNVKQVCALLMVSAGSFIYAGYDKNVSVQGYIWGGCYMLSLAANHFYIKAMFNKIPRTVGNLEKSYLMNLFALPALLVLAIILNEPVRFQNSTKPISSAALIALLLSCINGSYISLVGTALRSLISGTAFNVAGNASKFVTVGLSSWIMGTVNTTQANIGMLVALCGAAGFAFAGSPTPPRVIRDSDADRQEGQDAPESREGANAV